MFSNNEIRDILKVVDAQGYSHFEYDTEDFTLVLEKGDAGWSSESVVKRNANVAGGIQAALAKTAQSVTESDDGNTKGVRAPLPGTFYRAPKPGAAPFVEVGSAVDENTVVCIIESMKLMNSVTAGVRGIVAEICYEDGTFAEKSSILIRIEPEDA